MNHTVPHQLGFVGIVGIVAGIILLGLTPILPPIGTTIFCWEFGISAFLTVFGITTTEIIRMRNYEKRIRQTRSYRSNIRFR